MNSSLVGPSRNLSFFGMPRSRLGWWSIGLAALFLGLFGTWLLYVLANRIPRPTFLSDPLHACLILGAAAAGISGGIAGVLAVVAKRERSWMIVLIVFLGAFVVYLVIAKMINPLP